MIAAAVAAAAPAWAADWVLEAGTDEKAFYIDFESIRIRGDIRRAWIATDYSAPSRESYNNGARSEAALREFDCNEERTRVLETTFYKGQMAKGGTLNSYYDPTPWSYIRPGSTGESLLKRVCSFIK